MTTEKMWLKKMKGMKPEPMVNKEAENEGRNQSAGSESKGEVSTKSAVAEKKKGFDDVAGMEELKTMIRENIINVLKNNETAKAFGIRPPSVLFYGPAGCGKTYFAEKIAEELGINFVSVNPDDIASIYNHGVQQNIAKLFRNAERNAPTLLFLDEFDAMVPRRHNGESNNNGETNEFLCMLNNAADKGVYVLAATNHPECIDKAVLRTGRFDELVYIDLPDSSSRESLFRLELSKRPKAEDIDYVKLASLTEGYNCSDISYIVTAASRKMFNASITSEGKTALPITQSVLEDVISRKSPSVSKRDIMEFERLRGEYSPKDEKRMVASVGFV